MPPKAPVDRRGEAQAPVVGGDRHWHYRRILHANQVGAGIVEMARLGQVGL
jgi:hypothetical protein